MKRFKVLGIIACVMGFLGGNAGEEVYKVSGDFRFEKPIKSYWIPNGPKGVAENCKVIAGGRHNKALELNGLKQKVEVYSAGRLQINQKIDRVRLSLWVKGSGSFQVMLFCYAPRFVGALTLVKGKASGNWTEFKTEYKFDGKRIKQEDLNVRFALNVAKGGKVMFDDMSVERISKE